MTRKPRAECGPELGQEKAELSLTGFMVAALS